MNSQRQKAIQKVKQALLKRRDELEIALRQGLAELPSDRRHSDPLDVASELTTGEISGRLTRSSVNELQQIRRALVRLDKRQFGVCEECHKPIPLARLQALPFSILCVDCQRGLESGDDSRPTKRQEPELDGYDEDESPKSAIEEKIISRI